jgi:hypothetical protein
MQTETTSEAPAIETPEPEVSNTQRAINGYLQNIAYYQKKIDWLVSHADKIDRLPRVSPSGPGVDFDALKHDEVIKVIAEFGGKWDKAANGDRIDYQTKIDGMVVRCYQGEPPPSCQVVEVEEFVPEYTIPASTRKVRKLVCAEPKIQVV